MNFSLFMARRYLFSKKSHNLINVISGISIAGMTIGTAALIIVLSVFNGFEHVVKSLYKTFNPDLLVTINRGKTFHYADFPSEKIKKLGNVAAIGPIVDEDALFRFGKKQAIGKLRGYPQNITSFIRLDTMMQQGSFILQSGETNYAVVGTGIAWRLGIQAVNGTSFLGIFVPRRGISFANTFENAFNTATLPVAGIFSAQQDFDQKYVLTSLSVARKLMNYTDEATSVEIYLKKGTYVNNIQPEIQRIVGNNFSVKNRFQQNESLFKIMKSEKTAVFLILVFILILASFNMIGSISLLIVEKIKDMAVLKSMGAEKQTVKRIFLQQGILISFISASAGLLIGFIILWLQQTFGLIRLGPAGSYVINVYPVQMQLTDFVVVFFTVQVIGLLASWYPVHFLLRNFNKIKLQ